MLKSFLLLTVLLPLGAAAQDPAALVPADTLVFFGTDSVKAGSVAARKTAMSRIFQEADVRAFLHEPVAAAEGVLEAILQQVNAEAGAGGEDSMMGQLDLSAKIELYPADKEPLPVGRALFALTHVDFSTGQPDIGVVVAVELLDAQHVEMLRALWSQIPGEPQQGEYRGLEIHGKFMGPGAPPLSLVFVDDLAVMTTSERALHAVIDRGHGEVKDSLAATADYAAMLKASGKREAGSSTYFVQVPQLAALAKMGLTMGLSQAAQTGELQPEQMTQILGLFDRLGLDAVKLVGGVSKVAADGRIHGTSVARVDLDAPGLMASMVAGGGTIDRAAFEDVPADCLSASAMGLGTALVQFYDFAMDAARGMAPDETAQVEGMIAGALGGRSLRDDLLANMQDDLVSLSVPGQGFPGTPNTIMSMGLARPDDFVAAVSNLISFAAAQLAESNFEVALKESEFAGNRFFELDLSKTPLAAAGMSPAFALRDGRMILSDNAARLRGYLEGALDDGPRLAADPRFKAFADGLDAKGELLALSYSDTAENFSTMYGQLSGMLPMLPMMMGGVELPVDFSKLPREDSITKHLDISLGGGYRTEGGLLVNHTESSLSLVEMLPLAGVAGLIALGKAQGIEPQVEAAAVDPIQVASDDLRELKASVTVYKIGTGEYPATLDDLVRPLPDFPDGAYTGDALPMDPWGHAYRFSMEPNPRKNDRVLPKLWSVGPNGQDEGGEGDDVLVPGWN